MSRSRDRRCPLASAQCGGRVVQAGTTDPLKGVDHSDAGVAAVDGRTGVIEAAGGLCRLLPR